MTETKFKQMLAALVALIGGAQNLDSSVGQVNLLQELIASAQGILAEVANG